MSIRTIRQMARRARHEKYSGNPYVPLVSARLRAAVELHGRSLGELAEEIYKEHRLTCSKQNLHHLMHRGTRCRANLRQALAATLGAPEDFLSRKDEVMPPLALRLYQVVSTTLDPPGRKQPGDAKDVDRVRSRVLLAARRFIERCGPAIQRENRLRPGEDVQLLIGELLDPTLWRALLLNSAVPMSDGEIGEIVPLLAQCMEKILQPWLENRPRPVRLARRRIRHLIGVWERVFRRTFRGPPSPIQPRLGKPPGVRT